MGGRDPEPAQALWIRATPSGGFDLALVDRDEARGRGWTGSTGGPVPLVWRSGATRRLAGALLDHGERGFQIRLAPESDADLAGAVRRALEEGVNPLVASHGGRVLLVDAVDGVVRVRMEGGCQGCTAARETLSEVVVRHLEYGVPGIREVVDVTDHAAGENPWYAPSRDGGTALPVIPAGLHALREACS